MSRIQSSGDAAIVEAFLRTRAVFFAAGAVLFTALGLYASNPELKLLGIAGTIVFLVAWWKGPNASPALAIATDLALLPVVAYLGFAPISFVMAVSLAGFGGLVLGRGRLGVLTAAGGLAGFTAMLHTSSVEVGATLELTARDWIEAVAVATAVIGVGLLFSVVGNLLRRREKELESLFQRLPVALYRTLPSGEVVDVNRATLELMGYDRLDEVTGTERHAAIETYRNPDDRKEWQARMATEGRVTNFEFEIVTRQGEHRTVLDMANTILGEDGRPAFYEGAMLDITPLRRAQQARERLARIIDATSDLVSITDEGGKVVYANPAAHRWFEDHLSRDGYHRQSQLVPLDLMRKIAGVLEQEDEWSGEVAISSNGDTRYMNAVAQRFESEDGTLVAAIGRDVTDERQAADRLKSLLKSKDEFVASVSHELRTPLTAVVGMAAELRDRDEEFDSAERALLVELIAEQSQEVADIVEDLLIAARADTDSIVLVREPIDLEAAVAMTIRALPTGTSTFVTNKARGNVIADGRRARQIIRNLLTNAVRYGGDEVIVATEEIGDEIEIRVIDNGPGVPESHSESIFAPFERAHAPGSQPASVGLGLTVSSWLAAKMGGELHYVRENDLSIFKFRLPRAVPPSVEDPSIATMSGPAPSS